ncbi:MAG: NodT family efflux transporter outer membrane factor (OMF) lipoprotein [Arenicella sp.]|jgi:NodT family efflux transporter outer membrane factor (OMF) lipoprotein
MKSSSAKFPLNTIDLNTMDLNRTDRNISLSLAVNGSITQPANRTLKVVGLATLLFISGCMSKVGELPEQAQIKVPDAWQPKADNVTTLESDKTNELNAKSIEEKPVVSGWLNSLNDDALNTHVEKALINNPDLLSSAARLKNAFEQVTITGSSLWPQLRFDGNLSTRESSAASASGGATQGENSTTEIRSIGGTLNIEWEADIWRKLSQRRKAAALDAKAQGELYKAAELSLVANVSRAWYNLATNKLQLDLAQKRLDSFQNTANLIEENYERGLRSALDVYLSRTDVQRQISALADSKFNYIQALRALKTLLGEYPDASLELNVNLPELDNSVPTGLPAELLTRRPDVRASQLQYQAQIANAKAAHRDRFPSLTFTGSIGESRDTFNSIFDSDNSIRNIIGSLTQPIFSAGALKAQEMRAYNDAEIAYASLVKTTLTAFEEVENSLTRETVLQEQHTAIKEAVKLAQGGLNLALDRYQSGIENYTTVLQSQRSLFDSLSNELNLRNALLQNRIGIHLALGGDFATNEDRQADEIPTPSITKTP